MHKHFSNVFSCGAELESRSAPGFDPPRGIFFNLLVKLELGGIVR